MKKKELKEKRKLAVKEFCNKRQLKFQEEQLKKPKTKLKYGDNVITIADIDNYYIDTSSSEPHIPSLLSWEYMPKTET